MPAVSESQCSETCEIADLLEQKHGNILQKSSAKRYCRQRLATAFGEITYSIVQWIHCIALDSQKCQD